MREEIYFVGGLVAADIDERGGKTYQSVEEWVDENCTIVIVNVNASLSMRST